MKKLLIALCAMLATGALAADVTVDLGELGALTIVDRTVAGVQVLDVFRAVLDEYQPIPEGETRTNAQYKALLVQYLSERGKADLGRRLQAMFERMVTIPDIRDSLTLTPTAE